MGSERGETHNGKGFTQFARQFAQQMKSKYNLLPPISPRLPSNRKKTGKRWRRHPGKVKLKRQIGNVSHVTGSRGQDPHTIEPRSVVAPDLTQGDKAREPQPIT